MAFAVLNLLFAPYWQYKVSQQIYDDSIEKLIPPETELEVQKEDVQQSFRHVFMHDLGVCVYIFALAASFVWSSKGWTWVTTSDAKTCNPDGGLSFSANIGWAFSFVFMFYLFAWYCCSCCAKATTIRKGGYEPMEQEEEEATRDP
mmetsp:Transcript_22855/g.72356  ORF Transcript_22855/g.72356 Transcript_22855/m.72356 type:complete len:146 (-) Transcript_22855:78-515(-)